MWVPDHVCKRIMVQPSTLSQACLTNVLENNLFKKYKYEKPTQVCLKNREQPPENNQFKKYKMKNLLKFFGRTESNSLKIFCSKKKTETTLSFYDEYSFLSNDLLMS